MRVLILSAAVFVAGAITLPASAEPLRSSVAFNNGIGEQTADQPADGVEVAYQVTLTGGQLDGCTVDIVEVLVPRDEGAWGYFDIDGEVTCLGGGFAYESGGTWDGNGFHATGEIAEGSGSGDFEGISGRVAQLGGTAAGAADGTLDVSYDLVIDPVEG